MSLQNQDLNIVLVYLGNKPPRYVRTNLNHLKSYFPEAITWLITDSNKVKRNFEKRGHKVWLYRNSTQAWSDIDLKMNFPREFRSGFWFLTLKRFKAIEAFMLCHPSPLLHVEADVFLMPNFPLNDISSVKKNLAFPLVSPGYAIASTLFIQSSGAITEFNDFVEIKSKNDSNAIDMTILYDYAKAHPEKVEILASGPSFSGKTKGYFDGAAFGTFLIGQDPRNYRGITVKYSPIDWHSDKVSELHFALDGESLVTVSNGVIVPIFSLHIHTKKAGLFRISRLLKELRKAIREYELGPKKVLSLEVLIPVVSAALIRRVRKVTSIG